MAPHGLTAAPLPLVTQSLFTFVLKLHPVPTQGLSDSEHSSSSACTAVGAARTETCHQLKHLPPVRLEFPLLFSPLKIQPAPKECSTWSEAADCPQLLTALTIAQQCFSSPTPSTAPRVTLRLSGLSVSDLQTPLLCLAPRIRGGFFSSRKKQSISTLCGWRVSPQRTVPQGDSLLFFHPIKIMSYTNKWLQIKPQEERVTGSFTTHLRSPRIPKVCWSL